jgi:hypothetical protein
VDIRSGNRPVVDDEGGLLTKACEMRIQTTRSILRMRSDHVPIFTRPSQVASTGTAATGYLASDGGGRGNRQRWWFRVGSRQGLVSYTVTVLILSHGSLLPSSLLKKNYLGAIVAEF